MLSAPYRFRNRQRFKQALALPRLAGNPLFSLCGVAMPPVEGFLNPQKSSEDWPAEQTGGDLPTQRAVVALTTQWSVVVSKKVCRKAVDRNRLRRRLQALLRQHIAAAKTSESSRPCPPWQHYRGLVLITRPPAADASFEELAHSLTELLKRIRPVAPS